MDRAAPGPDQPAPAELASKIAAYLADHPAAAVLEEGRVLFDMRSARYGVTESHGRCLLQLWSDGQNLMRSVIGVQQRANCLRITTRRMGTARPQMIEFVPTSDRRTPTGRQSARKNFQRVFERVLTRNFLGAKVDGMRSAMDLEHSFGPAYARGRLLQGPAAYAIIGVGPSESSATIDGILTLGILWLEYCRQHTARRRHIEGLKVFVPAGAWRTTAERMAWLNHATAKFELYTIEERTEELVPVDFRDTGNLESRLQHAYSEQAALERCRRGIDRILALTPPNARERIELRARTATEVALLLHGLEFARVRHGISAGAFKNVDEISFGAGINETPLSAENEAQCRELLSILFASRHCDGDRTDPLFRMQPERWLEAKLRRGIAEILLDLRGDTIYSQVPALSSGERGMLDLLTLDRNHRLIIIEVKADEDLHLPLQALDYWIRVRALSADRQNSNGASLSSFERNGYFPGVMLSELPPRLMLVAPALRIHPANEVVLRYLSPAIEWELIALGEQWRRELRVIFRKRNAMRACDDQSGR